MDFGAIMGVVSHWPLDWIFIVAFTAIVFLDTLKSGTARAASVAVALPIALFVGTLLPKAVFVDSMMQNAAIAVPEALVFGIVFLVLYFLIHHMVVSFSPGAGIAQALAAAFGTATILLVVWLSVPALQSVWHFSASVRVVFAPAYRFWWVAAGYIALAYAHT